MPLPFLVAGAVIAAGVGIKKAADAKKDYSKAKSINSEARRIYNDAEQMLMDARSKTTVSLEELGKLKLNVWNEQMGEFVQTFSKIRHVDFSGEITTGKIHTDNKKELALMKNISLKASEVVMGGFTALGSGALAGIASYGGTMMFASASTGTAISALSGAAATNATLAWLGGGSLAAGGLGIAGGTAVLGGIVAGPVLAVGGMILAAKARESLANARENLSEAKVAVQEMKQASSVLNAIENVADEFSNVIKSLSKKMIFSLSKLTYVVEQFGLDYKKYDKYQKQVVYEAWTFAETMKLLLETPLLNQQGSLSGHYQKALDVGYELLMKPAK